MKCQNVVRYILTGELEDFLMVAKLKDFPIVRAMFDFVKLTMLFEIAPEHKNRFEEQLAMFGLR